VKRRLVVGGIVAITLVQLLVLSAFPSDAVVWLASDKNGQSRVTSVQEGSSVWICVYDPDENTDSGAQDRIWTDVKLMDPNTGAYIVWKSYVDATGSPANQQYDDPDYIPYRGHFPGPTAGWTGGDYLEETGADTGLFVSARPFRIGARVDSVVPQLNTHSLPLTDFQWGNYEYVDGIRGWFDSDGVFTPGLMSSALPLADTVCHGKVENMDTLVLIYSDPNDDKDVAVSMAKIGDTESKIAWDSEIYRDARGAATITVTDPDENLDSSKVEYAPVFIFVNPGSWNPVDAGNKSANDFWMLQRYGGVSDIGATAKVGPGPIDWFNIYDSGTPALALGAQPTVEGSYYVQYPKRGAHTNVSYFDTSSATGVTRVMFYAEETGANTGVFEIHLSGMCRDLGFNSLQIGDVLVAYYQDPNDEDDFSLGATYVGTHEHVSTTRFTDSSQVDKPIYWIGRDPLCVEVNDTNANTGPGWPEQVVAHISDPHSGDSEWIILDETSSNSPVFFTNFGTELDPVWDAMGVGTGPSVSGGYQPVLDNWRVEVLNEDDVYVQYNDVRYSDESLARVGDSDPGMAFPPLIDRVRVANDVSFDLMSIADTQVYNGQAVQMWFLDRQGNRVNGYVNSDCVFIEVVDPDQNEDAGRRERVDAYWDCGQNWPFGPFALNGWNCGPSGEAKHPFSSLLGDTNVFGDGDRAMTYILNPRSGYWAALDLLETGVASGDFVSVICVDLVNVYTCVPSLGAVPGDTILAAYTDPSNRSDTAWIAAKVGQLGAP
jgi:hypothetical protein